MGIIDAVWMLMDAVKGLVEAASRVDVGWPHMWGQLMRSNAIY